MLGIIGPLRCADLAIGPHRRPADYRSPCSCPQWDNLIPASQVKIYSGKYVRRYRRGNVYLEGMLLVLTELGVCYRVVFYRAQ